MDSNFTYSNGADSVMQRIREEMAIKKCQETKELLDNLGYSRTEIKHLIDNVLDKAV